MTEAVAVQPVRKSIEVELNPLDAFQLFTYDMAAWWPSTHHIAKTPFLEIVIEPRAGGRWFEVDRDGSTCQWGSVLTWDPPNKVVFAWGLQGNWEFSPDPDKSSEVEVRFTRLGDSATLVELEHRHFERHEAGAKIAESVDQGWTPVLAAFQALARQRSAGNRSK
ncbi:MAG: SRPBCC family protein [Acidobacteriaceae bacterium]|nr:SRPBCC family protein [Acidobacteriaceae bacterium]